MKCKNCNNKLIHKFVDLGFSPPSNSFLKIKDLNKREFYYPLKSYVCSNCWLVQIYEQSSSQELFYDDYPYLSSTSASWLLHAKKYSEKIIKMLKLTKEKLVVEIGSNDGYLLQYFVKKNIPVIGIEPTKSANKVAKKYGYNIVEDFFTEKLSKQLCKKKILANLIICNNVYAHVPNIIDFTKGLSNLLSDDGIITIEFPHLMNLIRFNQFDTIYHEHFYYYSLLSISKILRKFNLEIFKVEKIPTHGGSLRVYIKKNINTQYEIDKSVKECFEEENKFGLNDLKIYKDFQKRVENVKYNFLDFLLKSKKQNKVVIAYGAAAKGNTFLNYAGVGHDLIDFVVDKSKIKLGKYLPGSHIPVLSDDFIKKVKPDFIIIFPWNIKKEIFEQLRYVRKWKGRFVTFIPKMKIYD